MRAMCNSEKLGKGEFSKNDQENPLCRGDQPNDKQKEIPSGDPSAKRLR